MLSMCVKLTDFTEYSVGIDSQGSLSPTLKVNVNYGNWTHDLGVNVKSKMEDKKYI